MASIKLLVFMLFLFSSMQGLFAQSAVSDIDSEEMELLMQSLEEDLEFSESEQNTESRPSGSSDNLDMSFILDVAGAVFNDPDPMQGGAHDPNHTGFSFQQLELHIESNVDPFFLMTGNLVFSQFGVETEEAYVTTLALPYNFQMRAGQFLHKIGRLNATHPHAWNFADQVLVNGKFFGGEGSRGVAGEISWLAPTPWFAEVIFSTSEAVGECCARSFYAQDDVGVNRREDLLYNARLVQFFPISDDLGLSLGFSGQTGPNSTGYQNRSQISSVDLYLRYKPLNSVHRMALSWQTEMMHRIRQIPDDRLIDWGGYSQLIWNINPRWETGIRGEYVSGVENDPMDPEWISERQRTSLQITFFPSHFSRIRLQGRRDIRSWEEEPSWGMMLSLEGVIGAHGGHEY